MQDPSSREVSLAFELPPTQRTRKARATRSKYAPRACQECRRRRAKVQSSTFDNTYHVHATNNPSAMAINRLALDVSTEA
jgi:hypothetical protein